MYCTTGLYVDQRWESDAHDLHEREHKQIRKEQLELWTASLRVLHKFSENREAEKQRKTDLHLEKCGCSGTVEWCDDMKRLQHARGVQY